MNERDSQETYYGAERLRVFLFDELVRPLDAVVIVAVDEENARERFNRQFGTGDSPRVREIDTRYPMTYNVYSDGCSEDDL